MPYTLAKFFLWGLLMALAGGIVGWLLRTLKSRGEVDRARAVTVDGAELERLRGRVANLEPLVAERDRLRMELADVRGSSAGVLGFAAAEDATGRDADVERFEEPAVVLDVAGASSVLGKKIKLDDLTVVEGIGPKIAGLCGGIGITTWQELSHTDVADLQAMLDAAGPRFQMHKPASWPQQAALLARGEWAEFAALLGSLRGT